MLPHSLGADPPEAHVCELYDPVDKPCCHGRSGAHTFLGTNAPNKNVTIRIRTSADWIATIVRGKKGRPVR